MYVVTFVTLLLLYIVVLFELGPFVLDASLYQGSADCALLALVLSSFLKPFLSCRRLLVFSHNSSCEPCVDCVVNLLEIPLCCDGFLSVPELNTIKRHSFAGWGL